MPILLRFLPNIAAGLGIIIIVFMLINHGINTQKGNEATAALKGVENHAKIEKKVMSLGDIDLEKRLSRWYRD